MTKNRTPTPVYLDPGMHSGLEVKGLSLSIYKRYFWTANLKITLFTDCLINASSRSLFDYTAVFWLLSALKIQDGHQLLCQAIGLGTYQTPYYQNYYWWSMHFLVSSYIFKIILRSSFVLKCNGVSAMFKIWTIDGRKEDWHISEMIILHFWTNRLYILSI